MNIGEANAWFAVVRALREPGQHDTAEAIELLTKKANAALNAGPRPDEVAAVVAGAIDTLAEFDDDLGISGWWPRIETAEVKGGVL